MQTQPSNGITLPWVELYRPKTITDMILPTRIMSVFASSSLEQNFLFVGTPGTGKTSLAKILAVGHDMLLLNASKDNGIDVIRTKISGFATTYSMTNAPSAYKVVILDEIDQMTKEAQKALLGVIEQFPKLRFIATCNQSEMLNKALCSRLEPIQFRYSQAEDKQVLSQMLVRIKQILSEQGGYTIAPEAVVSIIKRAYPDFRSLLNRLQMLVTSMPSDEKHIELSHVMSATFSDNDALYKFLLDEKRSAPDIFAFIRTNYSGKELACIQSLGTSFLDYLVMNELHVDKLGVIAIRSHRYMFESLSKPDPAISAIALCFEINTALHTQRQ